MVEVGLPVGGGEGGEEGEYGQEERMHYCGECGRKKVRMLVVLLLASRLVQKGRWLCCTEASR